MGVVKIGDKRYYLSRDNATLPVHHSLNGLSREWSEKIKKFFHIEDPQCELKDHNGSNTNELQFYYKFQWLVDHMQQMYEILVDPGSVLSYDEAMIRFMGRGKILF